MPKARSDKKFAVKVWIKKQNKKIFRMHCVEYHISMMSMTELMIKKCLDEFKEPVIDKILHERLNQFTNLKLERDEYTIIGTRVTNKYWQRLGYFAVKYDTSIAKIASCIFDYARTNFNIIQLGEKHGTVFKPDKKDLKFFY